MNKTLTTTQQHPLPPGILTHALPCGVSFDTNEKSKQIFSIRKNNNHLIAYVKDDQKDYIKNCAQCYNSYARYKDLFPGVDLYCHSFEKEFAYKLIIKEPGITTFPLLFQMKNIYLKRLEKERCILFVDCKTDQTVFVIQDPLIVDHSGDACPTISYIMQDTGDGMLVTLNPNQTWMKAKKRNFPLVVYTQILHSDRLPSPITRFESITAMELHFPVGIRHCFIPMFEEHTDYLMKTGAGWRLNVMQSVTPRLNEKGKLIGYNYLDGEGKLHILEPDSGCRDRSGSPSETIGELKVYYTYYCNLDRAYDDELHTYHNVFPFHIRYDPELRLLRRDGLHHYFDENGRLIRIANDRRVTLNIEVKKGRIYCVSNHIQKFHFAYKGKKLVAIIAPNHDRIDYKYNGDHLAEVAFSDGRKFEFSTSN